MPSRPRGDAKERTFNLLIRDGIDRAGRRAGRAAHRRQATTPIRAFANSTDIAPENRELFGEILDDHYVIEVQDHPVSLPLPVVPSRDLRVPRPVQDVHRARSWRSCASRGPDGRVQYRADRQLLRALQQRRRADAPRHDGPRHRSRGRPARDGRDRDRRRSSSPATIPTQPDGPGALLPDAHQRFQQDLATVLATKTLNRRDRVNAAVNIFYVHLGALLPAAGVAAGGRVRARRSRR